MVQLAEETLKEVGEKKVDEKTVCHGGNIFISNNCKHKAT